MTGRLRAIANDIYATAEVLFNVARDRIAGRVYVAPLNSLDTPPQTFCDDGSADQ